VSSARDEPRADPRRCGYKFASQSGQVRVKAAQVGRGGGTDLCLGAFQFVLELSVLIVFGSLVDHGVTALGQLSVGMDESEFLFHADGAGLRGQGFRTTLRHPSALSRNVS
jgi:hypothetical protein